ncbi:hypothetical protein [Paratractidigestivibacter sp.]|uniref:hypothetical protein n=1 Tax=Paratractidigestivibacter sp. TaxID=2847316 RepID=UPI002ACB0C4B|nr:hypothetical protein [Paratractidigestivibacter sp.]
MKDAILKGTGDSRYLKSKVPTGTTWEQALAMLNAGTFPVDLNGINSEGFQQLGTALNKNNLLSGETCELLGLDQDEAVPDDAYGNLYNLLDYKVGDVVFTARSTLGENWALCNGDIADDYDVLDYVQTQESKGIKRSTVKSITDEPALVKNNELYTFVFDSDALKVYMYKWTATETAKPTKTLYRTISIEVQNTSETYTIWGYSFIVVNCDGWVIFEIHEYPTGSSGSTQYIDVYAAKVLTDGIAPFYKIKAGARPYLSGSANGYTGPWYTNCKTGADTYGVVCTYCQSYSNSSDVKDRYYFWVFDEVGNRLVERENQPTTTYIELLQTNYAGTSGEVFWDQHEEELQFVYSSSAASKSFIMSAYYVDIAACLEAGTWSVDYAVSLGGYYYTRVAFYPYDDGTNIYMIPSISSDNNQTRVFKLLGNKNTSPEYVTTAAETQSKQIVADGIFPVENGFRVRNGNYLYTYSSFSSFCAGDTPVSSTYIGYWYNSAYTDNTFPDNIVENFGLFDVVATAVTKGAITPVYTLPHIETLHQNVDTNFSASYGADYVFTDEYVSAFIKIKDDQGGS